MHLLLESYFFIFPARAGRILYATARAHHDHLHAAPRDHHDQRSPASPAHHATDHANGVTEGALAPDAASPMCTQDAGRRPTRNDRRHLRARRRQRHRLYPHRVVFTARLSPPPPSTWGLAHARAALGAAVGRAAVDSRFGAAVARSTRLGSAAARGLLLVLATLTAVVKGPGRVMQGPFCPPLAGRKSPIGTH